MRKAIFAVSVVLLALLAVTCDSGIFPTNATPALGATAEPGYATVTIGIEDSISGARALLGDTAQAGEVDYYEVVFKAGSTFARSTWNGTGTWNNIVIPAVDYSAANNAAVVFVGKTGSPNILLGIGVINGSTVITPSTTSINFKAEPIKTGVAPVVANTPSTSSFRITAPASDTEPYATNPTLTDGTYPSVPIFQIPPSSTGYIQASWAFTNAYLFRAVIKSTGATITTTAVDAGVSLTIPPASVHPSSDGTVTFGGGVVHFGINTGPTEGIGRLTISVPVYAISSTAVSSSGFGGTGGNAVVEWELRGGLDNTADDTGSNDGGRVLVRVEPAVFKATIGIPTAPGIDP
jgi:hypothetical protein